MGSAFSCPACGTCHHASVDSAKDAGPKLKKIRIALAGNANVGKSTLFNYLTGMHQHVANWPGKTIERAEGTLRYLNYEVDVIDLPGIYSLSTFSLEEKISREYIINEKPDVVVNVVDSCALERNLFFTIQLIELGIPLVVVLNQTDMAKKKGITIDEKKLSRLLGVPVIKTVATTGAGVWKVIAACCELLKKQGSRTQTRLKYSEKLEMVIRKAMRMLRAVKLPYSKRYAVIKLFENDAMVKHDIEKTDKALLKRIEKFLLRSGKASGEELSAVISKERYALAGKIAEKVQTISLPQQTFVDKIDDITTHPFFGYVIMFLVLGAIFYSIFTFGGAASSVISNIFDNFRPSSQDRSSNLLWEGIVGGFVAGITLVLPYVLPFYLLLSLLEDTGYITRIAYLLDSLTHRIGLHGKAIIPLILGYGCNVPACFACRILEYERDRLITAFAITLVPCTARTVVVLALVGAYLGVWWALALYIFNLFVIAILVKLAFKILPGEPMGLIMEMPPYRMPAISVVLRRTWWKIKSILSVVFPYYIGGGFLFVVLYLSGVFDSLNNLLVPITEGWLGLPAFAATLLLFGIVRKEFIVVLPAVLYGTTDLATVFTPLQMIVLTVIAMFYVPCLATIEALRREFGTGKAIFITLFEIIFAVLLAGLVLRFLLFFGFK